MGEDKYTVDGYGFNTKDEYERAVKEKETIAYLEANTNTSDMKALLKIYNRSIEKNSFHTAIGLNYMRTLRGRLVGSGVVSSEALAPIPIPQKEVVIKREESKLSQSEADAKLKKYKEMYEDAVAGRIIKNIAIVILIIVIFAMIFITFKTRYSVFTYFTNYKENMRNELVDEYEQWEDELNKRQEELDQKEKFLDDRERKLKEAGESDS